MARKSRQTDVLKEGSSFRKVFASFMLTSEWKQVNLEFCKALDEAYIDRNEFARFTNFGTNQPDIRVYFIVKYPVSESSEQESPVEIGKVKSTEDFYIKTGSILAKDYLNEVVEKNFGKKKSCPTYNCREETVKEYWPEFARQALTAGNQTKVDACKDRIRALFAARVMGDELKADRQRFYERGAIDEIRAVVLKYYGKVTPEVIQEAMREVVITSIIDS